MSLSLRVAAASDIGLRRATNQDSGYASSHLLVLADGIGGALGGDIASSVTVAHLASLDTDVYSSDELIPKLRATLGEVEDDLRSRLADNHQLRGFGTTCIAMLRAGNTLAMLHIGDSRAYVLHEGALVQVTRDHTIIQELLDIGAITEEDASVHPDRHKITRALGDVPDPVVFDESLRTASLGDRWLLSSDGLFGIVSHETIENTLRTYQNLEECAQELINLALAAGAPDNVTVVLADVIEASDAEAESSGPFIVGAASIHADEPSRKGNSAAGKAAAYFPSATPQRPDMPEEIPEKKRKILPRLFALLATLAVVCGGLFFAYQRTQSHYYVTVTGGYVAIYQGIPDTYFGVHLSHMEEKTDVHINDLQPVARERLKNPVTRSSRAEAEKFVNDLRESMALSSPQENAKEGASS